MASSRNGFKIGARVTQKLSDTTSRTGEIYEMCGIDLSQVHVRWHVGDGGYNTSCTSIHSLDIVGQGDDVMKELLLKGDE